jgi:hypothetical protein
MNRRVVLCAGHGGGDSGAVGQGTTEAAECIDITNRTADKLRADGQVEVVVVPHELDFKQGMDWVNARYKNLEDGIALEIHKNSTVNAHGVETWFYGGDGQSQDYGQRLVNALAAATGLPNRGTKPDTSNRWGSLGWMRDVTMWSILAECGFISDGGDAVGAAANDKFAEGMKNGALAILGLSPTPAPAPIPTTPPVSVNFRVIGNDGKQIGAYKTEDNAWNKYQSVAGAAKIVDKSGNDVTAQFVAKYRPVVIQNPAEHPESTKLDDMAKDIGLIKAMLQWLTDAFKSIFNLK